MWLLLFVSIFVPHVNVQWFKSDDQLITNLAQISALKIVSRTSAMRYKGTKKSMPEIARELHVDAVVEGAVIWVGGRVRISAQLIEAPTDHHLWAASYERDLRDVLSMQEEVTRAIVSEIRVKLGALDNCCCVQREGKTRCTLADTDVGTWCCTPVPRDEKKS